MESATTIRKDLAPPEDLSRHFSRVTTHRVASKIKQFYKYFAIPGIGQLAGGLPNANYFPCDTLEATVALPTRWKPTPNDPVDPPNESSKSPNPPSDPTASRVVVPHESNEPNVLRKIDLTSALQYGTAQGYPALYYFLREFTRENLHPNVPYKDGPEIILTCGSTDGMAKSLECFSNVWDEQRDWIREREGILCEEFAYMNAIQQARPRGLNVVPVAIDDEGMTANGKGGLAEVLKNWDFNKGKRPHLMYTVTMGQNPTSGLLSLQRRQEIYNLCHEYDILIIEDDPYWYLQYPSANKLSTESRGHPVSSSHPSQHNYNAGPGLRSSKYPFLDSLVPSYLHVDTDGRVIRLDTFSKTVAPGCRLGWITAQPAFVEKILRITETTTQQPSGFVQSMIAELIMGPHDPSTDGGKGGGKDGAGWKVGGWVRWLEGLRGNYERRMQIMSSILEDGKYTVRAVQYDRALSASSFSSDSSSEDEDFQLVSKTQMYDFVYPLAGMFLWLHVHFQTHPLYANVEHERLARALWIFCTQKPYLVLLSPGSIFAATDEIRDKKSWQYFRLCFAAVDDDIIEKVTKSTVKAFHDFWMIKKVKDIDAILKDDEDEAVMMENMKLAGIEHSFTFC